MHRARWLECAVLYDVRGNMHKTEGDRGCGRLWKTVKNVTAKSIAEVKPATYIAAHFSTDARSQMST